MGQYVDALRAVQGRQRAQVLFSDSGRGSLPACRRCTRLARRAPAALPAAGVSRCRTCAATATARRAGRARRASALLSLAYPPSSWQAMSKCASTAGTRSVRVPACVYSTSLVVLPRRPSPGIQIYRAAAPRCWDEPSLHAFIQCTSRPPTQLPDASRPPVAGAPRLAFPLTSIATRSSAILRLTSTSCASSIATHINSTFLSIPTSAHFHPPPLHFHALHPPSTTRPTAFQLPLRSAQPRHPLCSTPLN